MLLFVRVADRMGFTVPEKALNVTLQQAKFHEYVQMLTNMLDKYHALLSDLKPVEVTLCVYVRAACCLPAT